MDRWFCACCRAAVSSFKDLVLTAIGVPEEVTDILGYAEFGHATVERFMKEAEELPRKG